MSCHINYSFINISKFYAHISNWNWNSVDSLFRFNAHKESKDMEYDTESEVL